MIINKQTRKFLEDWIIPQGYQRIIQRMKPERSPRVSVQDSEIMARNAKFRDLYAGRRCFVIGNGPSLKQQNLDVLKDDVTIAMNYFFKHPVLGLWQPTAYCVAENPENYTPRIIQDMKSGIAEINSQAIFIPLSVKQLNEQYHIYPKDRTSYLNITGGPIYDWPIKKRIINLTSVLPGPPSTAHMAIMVALYLGCSPIYLIGLDSDYLAHRSYIEHFYPTPEEERHNVENLLTYSYKTLMDAALKLWMTYEALRDIALQDNKEIYNAGVGGFLDVFPRVKFESLFR